MALFRITPRTYHVFVERMLKDTQVSSPRGLKTYEHVNAHLWMPEPLDRLVTNQNRKLNLGFAILEFVALVAGIDDIKPFQAMIKSYGKYSSDGVSLDGAYGSRVIPYADGTMGQLDSVLAMLKADPDSRRGIVSIYSIHDTIDYPNQSLSVPCTLTLQFMIRDGRLVMITNMRSNDLYLGLPYDVFAFTMLQEFMAGQLGIEMGPYYHNVGSLHAYERDIEKLLQPPNYRWYPMMEPMELGYPEAMKLAELAYLLGDGNWSKPWLENFNGSQYARNLAFTMALYASYKTDPEFAVYCLTNITDLAFRHVIYGVFPYENVYKVARTEA